MTVNFLLNSYFIQTNSPKINAGTLVTGDSYTALAINPEIMRDSANISIFAEPYIITYFKMRKILKTNSLRTILIGYSYHNISAFNDTKFKDPVWSHRFFEKSYPILSLSDLEGLDVNYLEYIKVINKYMCSYPSSRHYSYIGSFQRDFDRSEEFNSEEAIERHFFIDSENAGISKISENYLDMLLGLANERNIKVILLSTPLHKSYLDKVPVNFKEEYDEFRKKILKKYANTAFWDYSKLFSENKYFKNTDHLNIDGANKFSQLLRERLQKKIDFK